MADVVPPPAAAGTAAPLARTPSGVGRGGVSPSAVRRQGSSPALGGRRPSGTPGPAGLQRGGSTAGLARQTSGVVSRQQSGMAPPQRLKRQPTTGGSRTQLTRLPSTGSIPAAQPPPQPPPQLPPAPPLQRVDSRASQPPPPQPARSPTPEPESPGVSPARKAERTPRDYGFHDILVSRAAIALSLVLFFDAFVAGCVPALRFYHIDAVPRLHHDDESFDEDYVAARAAGAMAEAFGGLLGLAVVYFREASRAMQCVPVIVLTAGTAVRVYGTAMISVASNDADCGQEHCCGWTNCGPGRFRDAGACVAIIFEALGMCLLFVPKTLPSPRAAIACILVAVAFKAVAVDVAYSFLWRGSVPDPLPPILPGIEDAVSGMSNMFLCRGMGGLLLLIAVLTIGFMGMCSCGHRCDGFTWKAVIGCTSVVVIFGAVVVLVGDAGLARHQWWHGEHESVVRELLVRQHSPFRGYAGYLQWGDSAATFGYLRLQSIAGLISDFLWVAGLCYLCVAHSVEEAGRLREQRSPRGYSQADIDHSAQRPYGTSPRAATGYKELDGRI